MSLARSYRVLTLGCKLNQFDSAAIEGSLRARGFMAAEGIAAAGVVVVNTCTVTERADREARRILRGARRENPGCRLIVTGCYAERDRAGIAAFEAVDEIVGHSDRARLPEILDAVAALAAPSLAGPEDPRTLPSCIAEAEEGPALHFGERTRAFLKVQEGCNLTCSYCIIPAVRGPSRSVPPERLERTLAGLVARGFREIVLTGVNTGDYGKDLDPRTSLEMLLERLLAVSGLGRLRLNSLEPRTVTGGVAALVEAHPKMARHLQIPLQSGCDRTLERMRRNYRTGAYLRLVTSLRDAIPDIGLGADVIVGFPGETRADFEESCAFIERAGLNYLHVFSYSDRPGTPASTQGNPVSAEEMRERSVRLRELGQALALAFRRSFIGRTLPALVLAERLGDGLQRALTDNFLDLAIAAIPGQVNTIVPALVTAADDRRALARVEGEDREDRAGAGGAPPGAGGGPLGAGGAPLGAGGDPLGAGGGPPGASGGNPLPAVESQPCAESFSP